MDLTLKSTTVASDDQSWLGSAHGTTTCDPVTLDAALFSSTFRNQGFVPSGVLLGKVTATGRYGPYDDAAVDGRAVAAGLLFHSVEITQVSTPAGAIFWHGQVIEAKLPAGHGLDANGRADLKHISFV